jgi:hypothetical protein
VEVSGNLKLEGQLQLHGNGEITGPMSLTGPVLLSGGDLTLVGGDIKFEGSADCAEDFTIGTAIGVDPGTVVVLGPEGTLFASHVAYDKRVVGVVSGGGGINRVSSSTGGARTRSGNPWLCWEKWRAKLTLTMAQSKSATC